MAETMLSVSAGSYTIRIRIFNVLESIKGQLERAMGKVESDRWQRTRQNGYGS